MKSWWQPTQYLCLRCALRLPTSLSSRTFSNSAQHSKAKITALGNQARKIRSNGPHDAAARENKDERRSWKPKAPSRIRRVSDASFDDRFNTAMLESLNIIKNRLKQAPQDLTTFKLFRTSIVDACNRGSGVVKSERQLETSFALRHAFGKQGHSGLQLDLERRHQTFALDQQFPLSAEGGDALADFRFPSEWYPVARSMQRKIHLHVGPTNSGKTYHALQKLEKAKSGFYGGPLRLLAHEIYNRLNKKGISCALITGDEIRVPEGEPATIFSNTVEMLPIGHEVEVGVIDEIQMIADPRRGWAWTRALLGCQARELHLCGEQRAVPLIQKLVSLMGDTLEIHEYHRLNPLKTMTTSLKGKISRLQKGDCVVAFSRVGIHALKQEIEKATGRRAAIVYGSLPAEIRTQQADLFNDPNNDYDFLVASDAIGMGLNLSCKRVIFESVMKRQPAGIRQLSISEVKQIGGRAGRYRSAGQSSNSSDKSGKQDKNENIGFVTCLEEVDLPYIRDAMQSEGQPLEAAGILPLDCVVENYSNMFPPGTPFGYIYERLQRVSRTNSPFFLCRPQDAYATFGLLDDIKGLTIVDKMVFMTAPLRATEPAMVKVIRAFAECVGQQRSGALLDIPELDLEILDKPVSGDDKEYLRSLEALHRSLILYLWLGYRFGGVFTDRTLATHAKEIVEVKMDRTLTEFSANSKLRKQNLWKKRVKAAKEKYVTNHVEEPTGITDTISDSPELEEIPALDNGSLEAELLDPSHRVVVMHSCLDPQAVATRPS